MSRLGIVVTVYNKDKYLSRCVESILSQSFSDWYLVLVDDGSSDNSGRICDEYEEKDNRIKVIHQKNKGKLGAHLTGAMQIESDYITSVDADDWIDQETYANTAKYMEMNIDMIAFGIVRYYNELYQFKTPFRYIGGLKDKKTIQRMFSNMIWRMPENSFGLDPSLCTKIIKTDVFIRELEIVEKRMNVSYGQDVAVIYPLMRHIDSLMIINKALYYHRQREIGELPDYETSHSYFNDLATIYDYIGECFDYEQTIMKQLDYLVVYESQKKLNKYCKMNVKSRYHNMFPFSKIKKGSRIVLYGASDMGQEYREQLDRTGYAEVVMWVDLQFERYKSLGVVSPFELYDCKDIDYIVIAATMLDSVKAIEDFLIQCGFRYEQILSGLAG